MSVKQTKPNHFLNIEFCVLNGVEHLWFEYDIPLPRKYLKDNNAQCGLAMDFMEKLGWNTHKTSFSYEVKVAA